MNELYLRNVLLNVYSGGSRATQIENLKIVFDCEKTNESTPNSAEIQIYNLSERSRGLLEAKNTRIELLGGYRGFNANGSLNTGTFSPGTVDAIFIGDISRVIHKVDRTDIVSTIEVEDGGNRYRQSRLNKGYPPNTRLQLILDDLVTSLGLAKGAQIDIPNKTYANGVAMTGSAKDSLDKICKSNGLEWSIQNESVQIIQKNSNLNTSLILLNSDTGLIGSPDKTKEGIEFTSLLMPVLIPGKRVKIESKFISGVYKIRKVNHKGSNKSDDSFLSMCEATKS